MNQGGKLGVVEGLLTFNSMAGSQSGSPVLGDRNTGILASIVHNTGIKICSSIVIFFQNFVQYWYTRNVIKILYNTGLPVM